jgi:hypothetical protein
MLTEIGKANIRNLARYADTIEATPNLRVRALLNRLSLELVGDIGWPEHVSIFHVPWRIAKMHQIPLIFYGECPQNAYGGPMDSLEARQMTRRWITEFGGHLGMRPVDLVGQHGLRREDIAYYMMPADTDGIEAHFLGAYFPWDSHRNARVAVAAGMQAVKPMPHSWWTAENLDNGQTSIHDYFGYLKFAYNRLCAQISVDIRYGMISREEAIDIVRQDDGKIPWNYMGIDLVDALSHIGLTFNEFIAIAQHYANKDLFDVSDAPGQWPMMKPAVWENSFLAR